MRMIKYLHFGGFWLDGIFVIALSPFTALFYEYAVGGSVVIFYIP